MSTRSLPTTHRSGLEQALASAISGDVRFDAYTRHLFSTDASMYAIPPVGVVFPKDADDVATAVTLAAEFDVPVLPRGGGTGLAGETVGEAIVLDFSRYMTETVSIDPHRRTARVQPGVVQDDLNRAAATHGLFFAPDTSTSSRATIGGMIGNNSCGARSARYGMTIDHVESLTVVLADGSTAELGPVEAAEVTRRSRSDSLEGRLYRELPLLIEARSEAIRRAVPNHWRRSGGYRLERMLPDAGAFNLANLVVGSQGTLAVVVEATVRLEPRPGAVAGLVTHFETVREAVAASHLAMEEGATTVELVDRMILNLARTSPIHGHLAERLIGDPGAILWTECYGDTPEETAGTVVRIRERLEAAGHGYAFVQAPGMEEQRAFRELRKAGLGLLMAAGHGRERTLAFVEDTAVDPARLPEYTDRLSDILEAEGLRAGFYGHCSAGCIHLRPFMDLTRDGSVQKLRRVAEAVLDLVIEFGGMNSSEHGDGLARSEFNARFFGPEFYSTMSEVKRIFDPDGRFNPGKKVDAPPMDQHLRDPQLHPGAELDTHFRFEDELGMWGAANRCMRIGACRKSPASGGAMCPSYMATREEQHSTRGRANALVRALSMPDPGAALDDDRLYEILDLCLECKACQSECPLSVDMAALKSEFLAHYQEANGVPLRARIFGHVRTLNRLGSAFAPLSNLPGSMGPLRGMLDRVVGIDRRRPLPRFQRETLQRWFARRRRSERRRAGGAADAPRGRVAFLADSFTSFTEPEIGRAAIELLEAAGWEVQLAGDVCCGRSLISKGLLKQARKRHEHLLARLGPLAREGVPIVGCEPSCVLTLEDELPQLSRESDEETVAAVAGQSRLVEDLIAEALDDGALELDADSPVAGRPILFHGHCHQKAAGAVRGSIRLLEAIPGARVEVLDAGCCGMAGSFGFETEHYELSMTIGGQRLFPAVEAAREDALFSAAGVSCRQQIAQGTGRAAEHPVVLLRRAVRIGAGRGRADA